LYNCEPPYYIGVRNTWCLSLSEYGKIKFHVTYDTLNGPVTTTLTSSSTFSSYHPEWINLYGYSNGRNSIKLYINGICESSAVIQGTGLSYAGLERDIYVGKVHIYAIQPYGFKGLMDDLVLVGNHDVNQVSERGFFDLDIVSYDSQNQVYYVEDESSFDNRLKKDTLTNPTANGAFGPCLPFTGQSSEVWRIDDYDIIDLSQSFTIEVWANLTQTGSPRTLVSQGSDSDNTRRTFVLGITSNDVPYFSVYTTSCQTLTVTSSVDLLPNNHYLGNWHHIMAQFINRGGGYGVDEISLYVDGYLDRSIIHRQVNIAIESSTQPILLGGSKGKDDANPSNIFYGTLDELRFCQGIRTLYEDYDNDGMSDVNEIMRSTMSDQFHPYRHNSRFAIISSAVAYRQTGAPSYQKETFPPSSWTSYTGDRKDFSEDTLYQYSADEMYKCLRELNYQDEDIIYLTSYNDAYYGFSSDFTWKTEWNGIWYNFLLSDFCGSPLKLIERSQHRFPIDGLLTIENFRGSLSGLGSGGQFDIVYRYSNSILYTNEVTLTKLDNLDNLFVFYIDHGGNGYLCSSQYMINDAEPEPNFNNDKIGNGGDEFIKAYSVATYYNTNKLISPGVPGGTRNICAMEEVEYFDDEMRYDLDQISNVRSMTIIIHACSSGGFIEDLNNQPPHLSNRILISSCGETESSTPKGPLFCEWLNERSLQTALDPPHNIIENADRNIGNLPFCDPDSNPPVYKDHVKLEQMPFSGNHDNKIISIHEMYFNSVYTSCIDSVLYTPVMLIGDLCYEQIYL
jgi:hypothetical protein